MRTIGIIGGLGPETTAKFYLQLVLKAFKLNPETRPAVLMWSVPLNYQVEADFINGLDRSNQYIDALTDAAKRLQAGGADLIVIPCNSVHIFIEKIRQAVTIPVMSIVEETVSFLRRSQISHVGLLATTASVKSNLYQKELITADITIELPSEQDQSHIGNLINKLVRMEYGEVEKTGLDSIITRLGEKGVSTVLLACTDLQLLAPKHEKIQVVDTMEILLEAAVKKALD